MFLLPNSHYFFLSHMIYFQLLIYQRKISCPILLLFSSFFSFLFVPQKQLSREQLLSLGLLNRGNSRIYSNVVAENDEEEEEEEEDGDDEVNIILLSCYNYVFIVIFVLLFNYLVIISFYYFHLISIVFIS